MIGHAPISSIYRQGQPSERQDQSAEVKTALWHKLGLAVVDPEDIDDPWIRQAIINHANHHYGRRTGKNGKR